MKNVVFNLKSVLISVLAAVLLATGTFALSLIITNKTEKATAASNTEMVGFYLYVNGTEITNTSGGKITVMGDSSSSPAMIVSWQDHVASTVFDLNGNRKSFSSFGVPQATGSWLAAVDGVDKYCTVTYTVNGLTYGAYFVYGSGYRTLINLTKPITRIPTSFDIDNNYTVTDEYDGTSKSAADKISSYLSAFHKIEYDTAYGAKPINAGTYTAWIKLQDGYSWSNGSMTPRKVTHIITPKYLGEKPTLTPVEDLVYNGTQQTGVNASGSVSSDYYTLSQNTATEAGTYTATAELNDKNYCWGTSSGAADTANVTQSWTIAKARQEFAVPESVTVNGGETQTTFEMTAENPLLFNAEGVKVQSLTPDIATATYNQSTREITVTRNGENYGVVQLELTVEGTSNLEPAENTINVNVKPNSGFAVNQNGEEKVYSDWESLMEALSGETGEVVITVKGEVEVEAPLSFDITNVTIKGEDESSKIVVVDNVDPSDEPFISVSEGKTVTFGENLVVDGEKLTKGTLADVTGGVFNVSGTTVCGFGDTAIRMSGGNVTLNKGAIFSNNSGANGGAVHADGGNLTLGNVEFTENTATENGGAIWYKGDGNLSIEGETVSSPEGETLSARFSDNQATANGGAVYYEGTGSGTFNAEGAQFNGNSSEAGGAIAVKSGNVATDGCSFNENSSANGGAVIVEGGIAEFKNGSFKNNSGENGGAIYQSGGVATVDGVEFTGNTATANGGAVSVCGDQETTFNVDNGTVFDRNSSEADGGAIAVSGSSATLNVNDGSFTTNTAGANGGAIAVSGGTAHLKGNYSENSAGENGGAIAITESSSSVDIGADAVIENNEAIAFGNGIVVPDGGSITVDGGNFANLKDGVGLVGESKIIVKNKIADGAKLTVEFENPEIQSNQKYIEDDPSNDAGNKNTNADLKNGLRVKNPGYTFSTESDEGSLTLVSSESVVAMVLVNGEPRDCYSIEGAIKLLNENGGDGVIYLVQHYNLTSDPQITEPEPIEIDDTLVLEGNVKVKFETAVRLVLESDKFEYIYEDIQETIESKIAASSYSGTEYNYVPSTLIRGDSLKKEMIRVESGASLELGSVILDGGAEWTGAGSEGWTEYLDTPIKLYDENGAAGTVKTNNEGITAYSPVIVNRGTLDIVSATIQNNDNNFAKPGEGFGSQYYGGIRNEGSGKLTMTGGVIRNCYSREGGGIMNINKPGTDGYDENGSPSVEINGGAIQGNVSQQKGAAIQSIYGNANTTVVSGEITGNHSLNDLGVLAVEEGASLTIQGGKVTAEAEKNAVYLYNKYSADDVSGAQEGAKPFIEGNKAGELKITDSPEITGKVHIDDPCIPNDKTDKFDPFADVTGYTGTELNLDVNKDRPAGNLAKGDNLASQVVMPENEPNGLSGTYYYVKDGELHSGRYDLTVTQNESGKLVISGFGSDVTAITVKINGVERQLNVDNNEVVLEVADTSVTVEGIKFSYDGVETELLAVNEELQAVQFDKSTLELKLPADSEYLSENGEYVLFGGGILPNDIKVENGYIDIKISNDDIRRIYIGERAEAMAENNADKELEIQSAATEGSSTSKLTVAGEAGVEYCLELDGELVGGDGLGKWYTAVDGSVTFEGLEPGKTYKVVARNAATDGDNPKLAGAYAVQGQLTALTSAEISALNTFNSAYGAVEEGIWTESEGEIVEPDTHSTPADIKTAIDAFAALTERLQNLPEIAEKHDDLLLSYAHECARGWETAYNDLITNAAAGNFESVDETQMKAAIKAYNELGTTCPEAQALVAEKFEKLLSDYRSHISSQIQSAADNWFVENGVEEEKDKDYYTPAVSMYKGMADNFDLNPANATDEQLDAAFEELKKLIDRTETALDIQKEYIKAAKNMSDMSDDKAAELAIALSDALEELSDLDVTDNFEQFKTQTTEEFNNIVAVGKAQKQYLDNYYNITGSEADKSASEIREVLNGFDTASDLDKALKDSLLELVKTTFGETPANDYVSDALSALSSASDGESIAAALEKFKNIKAVSEYLEAYKNINGTEADLQDSDVKAAVDSIVNAKPYIKETIVEDEPVKEESTYTEGVNHALATAVGALLEKAYKDAENGIIASASAAVEDAVEDAENTADGRTQTVAEVAEAVLGVAEKLSVQEAYDEIIDRNGRRDEKLTQAAIEELEDILSQAIVGIDEAADKAQAAAEAVASLGLFEAKDIAKSQYLESYKQITGNAAPDVESDPVKGALSLIDGKTSKEEVSAALKEKVIELLTAESAAAQSDKAKTYLNGLKTAVENANPETDSVVPLLGKTVKNAKAVQQYYDSYKSITGVEAASLTADISDGSFEGSLQSLKNEILGLLESKKTEYSGVEGAAEAIDGLKTAVEGEFENANGSVPDVYGIVSGIAEELEFQRKRNEAKDQYRAAYEALTGSAPADDDITDVLDSLQNVQREGAGAGVSGLNGVLENSIKQLVEGLGNAADSTAAGQILQSAVSAVESVTQTAAGEVGEYSGAVEGVKQKLAEQRKYDEIIEEYGSQMTAEGVQALEGTLAQSLAAIDSAVAAGATQSELEELVFQAESELELKKAAGIADKEYRDSYYAITGVMPDYSNVEDILELFYADEVGDPLADNTVDKIVEALKAAVAEKLGEMTDTANDSEAAKQLVTSAQTAVSQSNGTAGNPVPDVSGKTEGVKQKLTEQRKYDEIVEEYGSQMTAEGVQALEDTLAQSLAAIDSAVAAGATQSELEELVSQAESKLELKKAAGIADKEYRDSYYAITENQPSAEQCESFSAEVQAQSTKAGVNSVLEQAVKDALESLKSGGDSNDVIDIIEDAKQAVESAIAQATAGGTVPDLSEEVVNDVANDVKTKRGEEISEQKGRIDDLSTQKNISDLPEDLQKEANDLISQAKSEVESSDYNEYPFIEEKLEAQLDLVNEAAAKRNREGAPDNSENIDSALKEGLDKVSSAADSDDVTSAKQSALLEMEKEYYKQKLAEENANASDYVSDIVAEAQAEIDQAGSEAEVSDIAERYVPEINGEKFLDATPETRKDFGDITKDDKSALGKALEDYENLLDQSVKDYLNDKYSSAPYSYDDGYTGELQDRINKAEFEEKKQSTIESAEQFVKDCDGEHVKDVNRKQVENIAGEEYAPQKQSSERPAYKESKDAALEDKLAQAQTYTEHAQKVQRTENQVSEKIEELLESGKYNGAQKQQMQDILGKLSAEAETGEPSESASAELESMLSEALDELENVPVTSLSAGGIKPDKTSATEGGNGDYGESADDEVWGIVTNTTPMESGLTLVIERAETVKDKVVKTAAKQNKLSAAASSALSAEGLQSLVDDRTVKAAVNVYLTRGAEKVTTFKGVYTVKILMSEELRGIKDLQVARVNDDGTVELFRTSVEDGKYLVFSTTSLSEFQILGEKETDLTWLIVLLAILIAGELIAVAVVIFRKSDKKSNVAAVAPLSLLTVFTPAGAVSVCIVLGLCAVIAAEIFVVALLLKTIKAPSRSNVDMVGQNEMTEQPEKAGQSQRVEQPENPEQPADGEEDK